MKYLGLIEKINNDVSKFEWEGKELIKWNDGPMEAKRLQEELFEKWDEYKPKYR